MALPQLNRGSCAIGCNASLLRSRARTLISRRDMHIVGNRRFTVSPRRCRPHLLGTRTETLYSRDVPRLLRAVRSHPRASLSGLVSPIADVFIPLHDFGGNLFIGQEQAVTERSRYKNEVVSCLLQHPLILGTRARKARFPQPKRSGKFQSPWPEAPLKNGQSGHSYRPKSPMPRRRS